MAYKSSPSIASKPPSSSFPHFTLILPRPWRSRVYALMYVPAARLTSQLTVYGSVHAIRPSPSSLKYSSVLKLESTPQDLELSVDCISSPKACLFAALSCRLPHVYCSVLVCGAVSKSMDRTRSSVQEDPPLAPLHIGTPSWFSQSLSPLTDLGVLDRGARM